VVAVATSRADTAAVATAATEHCSASAECKCWARLC